MLEIGMPLRQNYSLRVGECDEGLVITVADQESLTVAGDYATLLLALGEVDGISTATEIERELFDEYAIEPSVTREILEFAWESNLIQVVVSPEDDTPAHDLLKWDRQIKNFTHLTGVDDSRALEYHRRIRESHVLVLGVGGVGGYMALGLTMMGVGRLSLIDHDGIELSNTSRQVLYTEESVGRSKLDVAADELLRRNPHVSIAAYREEIGTPAQLRRIIEDSQSRQGQVDLVVVSADTPRGKIAYIVDEACALTRTPSIFMGPHDFSKVTIGPLIVPGQTPRYSEYFPQDTVLFSDPLVARINGRYRANIMDPFNGLAAKMGAVEVCKFLSGYRVPAVASKVLTLDTQDWTLEEFDLGL